MIAQQWRQSGIDAKTDVAQGTHARRAGPPAISTPSSAGASRPGAAIPTCPTSSTAGIRSSCADPASRSRRATGSAGHRPALDKIIEQIRTIGFDDPKSLELGKEYVKLVVKEMPTIPLMAYNVFTVMDETYWTGYPSAEADPYTDPVPNWGNSQYMMVKLKPTTVVATCGGGEADAHLRRFLW